MPNHNRRLAFSGQGGSNSGAVSAGADDKSSRFSVMGAASPLLDLTQSLLQETQLASF